MGTGYGGYLTTHLSKSKKLVFNSGMERSGQYVLIPGSKLAKGIGEGLFIFSTIAGAGSAVGFGLSTIGNSIKNYCWDN